MSIHNKINTKLYETFKKKCLPVLYEYYASFKLYLIKGMYFMSSTLKLQISISFVICPRQRIEKKGQYFFTEFSSGLFSKLLTILYFTAKNRSTYHTT